jgi:outer membrane lipoprotein-sorting protein
MMRRSSALALAAVFCLAGTGRSAPQLTVDEVIAKNIEAKGGLAKLKAVTTIKQTSMQTMQGQSINTTTFMKRPNLTRTELSVNGRLVINAYDGNIAWIINPLAGSTQPVLVSGPQADMIRDQAAFDGPLVDYKEQGYTVTVEGSETMGDRNVVHLKLTSRKRQISHMYLDASTWLEAKLTSEADQFKLDQEFSDYRAVDGVMWAFQVRALVNGALQSEIKVQRVEFNTVMDDAMFRLPKGS